MYTFSCGRNEKIVISSIRKYLRKQRKLREVRRWEQAGCPAPPPHLIKQRILREYAEQYDCKVLVETGTFYGDMIDAMLQDFSELYTIELSEDLHKTACERFKGEPKVHLIQGDSGKELAKLVPKLTQRALFWLDGHYSAGDTALGDKETPVFEELDHLYSLSNLEHVILIDDAREFGGNSAYPTLETLEAFIQDRFDGYTLSVDTDIIRIIPNYIGATDYKAA